MDIIAALTDSDNPRNYPSPPQGRTVQTLTPIGSNAVRDELTGEWKNRGVQKHKEFAILTAEISKAAFGVTPSQYQNLKGLKRETCATTF